LTEIVAELGVELLGHKRLGGHPITLKLTAGIPEISGEVSKDIVLSIALVAEAGTPASSSAPHLLLEVNPGAGERRGSPVRKAIAPARS